MEASNVKAMRDALSSILGIADHLQTRFAIPKLASEEISELKQIAESALSAPPRNCDVLEEFTADDEFEKAMGFPPSKTADERDAIMRENWFLFKCWLFDKSKGDTEWTV